MRHINTRFIDDLLYGDLSCFMAEVKNNRDTLSLEVRNNYINIYYNGGSLLKIAQKAKGYSFRFDAKYCKHKGGEKSFDLLKGLHSNDIDGYKKHFHLMMQEMDAWFEEHPKRERDYQHDLLVNNPEIVDIEYQIGRRMRLDMLCFVDGKLYVIENKYGNGAIGGKSGMSEHYKDICNLLADQQIRQEMLESVCCISQAKKTLGLRDNVIQKDDIKDIEILFLMADYIPKGKTLSNELVKMDGRVPASILMIDSKQVKIDLSQAKSIF